LDHKAFRLTSEPILRAVRLNKVFWLGTAVYAVDNVTLDFEEGQYVFIHGPSGSGKSTLLSLLAGLDRPTSGKVIIDGQNIAHLSENARCAIRRQRIGFIPQFFNLLPGLTAFQNVLLPQRIAGIPKWFAERQTSRLLMLVGLGDRRDHPARQLSGGEQQRVAIARALANDPAILMADEPTANLDSVAADEFRRLLVELNRELKLTCLVVSHDHRFGEDADRTMELVDGRVTSDSGGGVRR